jgi:hypothetical protein
LWCLFIVASLTAQTKDSLLSGVHYWNELKAAKLEGKPMRLINQKQLIIKPYPTGKFCYLPVCSALRNHLNFELICKSTVSYGVQF